MVNKYIYSLIEKTEKHCARIALLFLYNLLFLNKFVASLVQ